MVGECGPDSVAVHVNKYFSPICGPVYELSKLWSKHGICLLSAHALAFTDECTHLHLPI